MTTLTINGKAHAVAVPEDTPLLWALRDELGLTGTKFGCGMGLCGACTIHIDGVAVRSCITPISAATGKQINTLQPGRSGDAGPSMVFEPSAVTVGAAMSYSPYFDKQRPIVPDHFPPKWLEELQERATEYGAKVLEIELGKET